MPLGFEDKFFFQSPYLAPVENNLRAFSKIPYVSN